MAKKVCIFTVQSLFQFPIDMLRYDACYPHTQSDVAEIENASSLTSRTAARATGKQFKVTLASQLIHNLTKERWSSFGWTVTDVTLI